MIDAGDKETPFYTMKWTLLKVPKITVFSKGFHPLFLPQI